MCTGVRLFVLLAALLVGCGGDDEPTRKSGSGPRLPAAPRAIADACAEAAASAAFPVLCPRRWPSPGGRGTARPGPKARLFEKAAGVYLVDVENGFRRRGGYVFHVLVGGQSRAFGRRLARADSDLRLVLPARTIRSARVHGTRATVLEEPRYPAGGLHGGHVVVLWNEGGHGYLASVHGERYSRDELVGIALALARSARR
jgi:hypothetical protein